MATHTSVCAALHCSSRQGKRPAPELRQSPAAGTLQALTQHWPHWLYSTLETDVACADGTAQPVSCQASLSWLNGARGEASVASVGCSAPPCDPEIERRAAAGATQAKRAEPVSLALSPAVDCDSAGPRSQKQFILSLKKKYISALGCRTTAALLWMDAVVRPAVPTHLSFLARVRLFRKKSSEGGWREREGPGKVWPKRLETHSLTRSRPLAAAPERLGPAAPPASSWVLLLQASSSSSTLSVLLFSSIHHPRLQQQGRLLLSTTTNLSPAFPAPLRLPCSSISIAGIRPRAQ